MAPLAFDPSRIPLGSSTSDLSMTRDSQVSTLGEAFHTAERVTVNGRDALRLVLEQRMSMGSMFDTLDVDAATLQPIRYRNEFGAFQSIDLDYARGGRITGAVTRSGQTVPIDTTVAGVFYDAADFQPLVPALPLAEGYFARIPVFSYDFGVDTLSVRVAGLGSVAYQGTDRPVWLVEYTAPGGTVATLSIDRETGHLLRTEAVVAQGAVFVQSMR
jgi:hypothetical protein